MDFLCNLRIKKVNLFVCINKFFLPLTRQAYIGVTFNINQIDSSPTRGDKWNRAHHQQVQMSSDPCISRTKGLKNKEQAVYTHLASILKRASLYRKIPFSVMQGKHAGGKKWRSRYSWWKEMTYAWSKYQQKC